MKRKLNSFYGILSLFPLFSVLVFISLDNFVTPIANTYKGIILTLSTLVSIYAIHNKRRNRINNNENF